MRRFEVVRRNPDQDRKEWHGRYIVNGRLVWMTPRLSRKVGVERAIESLFGRINRSPYADHPEVNMPGYGLPVEIHYPDERGAE